MMKAIEWDKQWHRKNSSVISTPKTLEETVDYLINAKFQCSQKLWQQVYILF